MAEFTLTDNSANTTTSLLRSLCHYDDSVLLGSWLQETDHKSIEDQVGKCTRTQKHQHNPFQEKTACATETLTSLPHTHSQLKGGPVLKRLMVVVELGKMYHFSIIVFRYVAMTKLRFNWLFFFFFFASVLFY